MKKMLKRLLTNPTSLTGILLLLAFAVTAVAAPRIAPPPENARDPYMIPRDGFSILFMVRYSLGCSRSRCLDRGLPGRQPTVRIHGPTAM